LVPLEALVQIAAQALKLPGLRASQVIEMRIFGE
jgi:hypothetical protein